MPIQRGHTGCVIGFVSLLSGVVYRIAAKPLLFRVAPDKVHVRTIRAAVFWQRWPLVRWLVRLAWAYRFDAVLGQKTQGLWFRNPIGLSAGFDKNFEMPPMMSALGFGFMEGGSVTFGACEGNPRPWFYRLPRSKSLVVHAGLANQGVDIVLARLRVFRRSQLRDFPLNISVAQTNSPTVSSEDQAIEDIVGSLRRIKRAKVAQLVTLNISCPNTYHGEPFTSPGMLERLLSAVDRLRLGRPVFIKMPNHLEWEEFERLLAVAAEHRVAGVTISNLAKRESGVQLADALPDSVQGGLSGKPTWERSNELIRRTYAAYGSRFTIIGVGGVFSAEDAYTKIRLGATLVELITGMIYEGPQLIGQINRGLVDLLRKDGFASVSDAIGVDAGRV